MYNSYIILVPSPLEQFEIVTILPISISGFNISITNSSLFFMLTVFIMILWLNLSFYKAKLIPNN